MRDLLTILALLVACDRQPDALCGDDRVTQEGAVDDELDIRSSYGAADILEHYGDQTYEIDVHWDARRSGIEHVPAAGTVPLRVRLHQSTDGRARLTRDCRGIEIYAVDVRLEVELGEHLSLVADDAAVLSTSIANASLSAPLTLDDLRPLFDVTVPDDTSTWELLVSAGIEYDYGIQYAAVELRGWNGPREGAPDDWFRLASAAEADLDP